MDIKLKVALRGKMIKFINEACETDEWTREDFYCPDEMADMMTNGAEVAFDAIVKGSQFTASEMGD